MLFQPSQDSLGSPVLGTLCELFPSDLEDSACTDLIKFGPGGVGNDSELLITRNTPVPTGNKVPKLLNLGPVYDSMDAADYDYNVICARQCKHPV